MDVLEEVSSLQKEVARLKQVNQDLYNFVAKKIVSKWGVKPFYDWERGPHQVFICWKSAIQMENVYAA